MTWGRGVFGQLGHGNNQNENVPTFVQSLSNTKTIYVSCGWQHTMALSQSNMIYSWVGISELINIRDMEKMDNWDMEIQMIDILQKQSNFSKIKMCI